MSASVREVELAEAFERLLVAAERAEEVMRAGNCPKCGAESVDENGQFEEEYALVMCATSEWSNIRDAVIEAREKLSDALLDRYSPGRRSLARANQLRIELDALEAGGMLR